MRTSYCKPNQAQTTNQYIHQRMFTWKRTNFNGMKYCMLIGNVNVTVTTILWFMCDKRWQCLKHQRPDTFIWNLYRLFKWAYTCTDEYMKLWIPHYGGSQKDQSISADILTCCFLYRWVHNFLFCEISSGNSTTKES